VLRFATKTIATIAICWAVGLQWFGLQSVAWATMMVRNARQATLCQALKRTFDATHPCSLCHIVNKANTSGQQRDVQTSSAKIDVACVSRRIRFLPRVTPFQYSASSVRSSEIEYSPPVPPPRLVPS
jgi:hypothetical protein